MPRPFLVTGASGFVGRHLLQGRAPHTEALALVRNRSAWAEQDWSADLEHVELVQGSVTETASWVDQLPPLAGIFHLAALVRHSRRGMEEVYATNVEGSLNMVRLAAVHKCRVVMLSTSGTVGCFRCPDAAADENAAFCEEAVARWPYYHSKIVAEKLMRRLADNLRVELVLIRPPMLLGPEDHRFRSTSNVLVMLRCRLPFLIHGGIHFVDVRDAVQAILHAMALPHVRPIYHLDGTCSSIEHSFGMIEEASSMRPPAGGWPERSPRRTSGFVCACAVSHSTCSRIPSWWRWRRITGARNHFTRSPSSATNLAIRGEPCATQSIGSAPITSASARNGIYREKIHCVGGHDDGLN